MRRCLRISYGMHAFVGVGGGGGVGVCVCGGGGGGYVEQE